MPYVYILRCADGTLYTGWTVDLAARLAEHNAGRGARYTRGRRPVVLVYQEELPTAAEAMRRERALQRLRRTQKLALINAHTCDALPKCVASMRLTCDAPRRCVAREARDNMKE